MVKTGVTKPTKMLHCLTEIINISCSVNILVHKKCSLHLSRKLLVISFHIFYLHVYLYLIFISILNQLY